MLKRASHIVLILILMVSTTGIAISKHYSMGELYDIAFVGEADHCCTVPCDCCEDEFEFHRLEVEFEGSDVQNAFNEIKSVDLMVSTSLFDVEIDLSVRPNEIEFANNHPPPINSFAISFTQSFLL